MCFKQTNQTIKCFILILLVGTMQSCLISNVTKHGQLSTCEIHNVKMHKALVKTHYGKSCPKQTKKEYKNAKQILCMGCVRTPARLGIKYYCRKCNKLKKADKQYWKQQGTNRDAE